MNPIPGKWLRLGALLALVVLAFSLSLANACSNATGPKYPSPGDSSQPDTSKTSFVRG